MHPILGGLIDRLSPTALVLLDQARLLLQKFFASPYVVVLASLVAAMAFAGYRAMSRNDDRFRVLRGRWFSCGFLLFAIATVILGVIIGTAPEVIEESNPEPWLRTGYSSAVAAIAGGLGLVISGIGFSIGGLFASRQTTRIRRGHPVVIAIDGPAASGKGTLAKRIADIYDLPCLDTGLLYRAVARDVASNGGELEDAAAAVAAAKALDPATLSDEALRTAAAGEAASVVAKFPAVRTELLTYQRAFAARSKRGAVLDGRDIGTIVCPQADVKIYVTATPEERARRRHLELEARGETVTYEVVLEDIRRRDSRDIGRTIAPLWPAKDAVTLDTTKLDADQALKAALGIIKTRLKVETVAT